MSGFRVTPEQLTLFNEKGILHIPGALAERAVLPVKTHVLNELKRLNIWSTGRTLSQQLKGVPVFQQTGKLGQLIRYSGLNEKLISPQLYSVMRQLAGTALTRQDGQLLISLPHQVDWTLDALNWHRDVSTSQLAGMPGVQAFILLDNVSVKGGATLTLAGSHRLQNQAHAKQGISELISGGADRGVGVNVGGIDLSIVEMAGRAGDVYLMDMRLLHTPSINASKRVRIMATMRYFAEV